MKVGKSIEVITLALKAAGIDKLPNKTMIEGWVYNIQI